MADISLDGLRIEVPHSSPSEEVCSKLLRFALDLGESRFSKWGLRVTEEGETSFVLIGAHGETHFLAKVEANQDAVLILLEGIAALPWLKLKLVGGSAGLLKRIHETLSQTIREELER